MTRPIDPDCTAGKHHACPGWVWSVTAEQAVPCTCPCHHQHEEPR